MRFPILCSILFLALAPILAAPARAACGPRGCAFEGGGVIVDQSGRYHGNASSNPYDPDSINNPNGRYGSPYSPDSLRNPYGAGNPYNGNQYRVIGR